jgi:hypothetical protein
MGSQVAARVVTGRAFNGGVAMSVTRKDGMVRIMLTCVPSHPAAASAEGETVVIRFPSPVPVAAGERAGIAIGWASGGTPDYAGAVLMPVATVLTCAHVRR